MTSKVEIINRALDLLGADIIEDPEQDIENARIMNRAYDIIRKGLLRRYNWNCAKIRIQLAPDATAPLFDYAQQFSLPADCLRPLFPKKSDWAVEGKKILTNEGTVLNLIYLRDLTDENEMDASLVRVFAAELAVAVCEKVTQSLSKRQEAKRELKDAHDEARKSNAYERNPDAQDESTWLDAMVYGTSAYNPMKVYNGGGGQ
jgi:uncharacterized protein YifE (UPF0438 family)